MLLSKSEFQLSFGGHKRANAVILSGKPEAVFHFEILARRSPVREL